MQRTLSTAVLLTVALAAASPATAQPAPASRAAVRSHPAGAEVVLHAAPAGDLLIYGAGDAVIFGREGRMHRERIAGKLAAVRTSRSGGRVGLLVRRDDSLALRLQVYRSDGARLFERSLPHHWDDPLPRLALAEGSVVYGEPATAEVVFLAPGGALLRRVTLFGEVPYALERNLLIAHSPDGRHVAVAAQRHPAHAAQADARPNAHLFLFAADGTLHWSTPLPEPGVQTLAFSPGGLVALSTYDSYSGPSVVQRSRLFNENGEQVFEAPVGAESFQFNEDGVLLVTKRSAEAFDLQGRRRLFTYRPEPGLQIVSAAAAPGAPGYALLTGRSLFADGGFAFKELRLLHVDAAGTVAPLYQMDAGRQRAPSLLMDPDAGHAVMVLDKATYTIRLPR